MLELAEGLEAGLNLAKARNRAVTQALDLEERCFRPPIHGNVQDVHLVLDQQILHLQSEICNARSNAESKNAGLHPMGALQWADHLQELLECRMPQGIAKSTQHAQCVIAIRQLFGHPFEDLTRHHPAAL